MPDEGLAPETIEDVLRLLEGCPAFLGVDRNELEGLAHAAELIYVALGKDAGAAAGSVPLVVMRGALLVRDSGNRTVDLVAAGEYHMPTSGSSLEAIEAALLVLLPDDAVALAWSAAPDRLRSISAGMGTSEGNALQTTPVRVLMRAGLVTIHAEQSCREAAERMREHAVSALVVLGGVEAGIVTDRDLRNRLVAEGRAPHLPVRSVATFPVRTITAATPQFEALLEMLSAGVHHLPVMDQGHLVGMLSAGDLLRRQTHDPLHLRVALDRATSVTAVADALRSRVDTVEVMLASGMSAGAVAQVLTAVTDRVIQRLLSLATGEIGRPPSPFAWLAFGSQARREQTLFTDQDTGLLLPDGLDQEARAWFARLGLWMTEALAACGYRRCEGGVMAANDQWRRDVSGWRERFTEWMATPTGAHLLGMTIAFDLRTVAGTLAAEPLLHPVIAGAAEQTLFLGHLAREAVAHRPPLGFLGRLVVARSGEHAGAFQVKAGTLLPIIDLARFHTLARGGTEVSTSERLAAAAAARQLSADLAATLREGYELALRVRLEAQVRAARDGRQAHDWIDPAALPPLLRSQLREVFKAIRTAQDALEFRRQTAQLG